MKRVIIESPYAGNVPLNTLYARAALADCLKRGEAPFASHLLYTQPGVLDDAKPDQRAKGIAAGHAWMQDAEVIAVYADLGISEGMKQGIEAASKVNTTFANRPVIEFRTLPEFVEAEKHRDSLSDMVAKHLYGARRSPLQGYVSECEPFDYYSGGPVSMRTEFNFPENQEPKVPRREKPKYMVSWGNKIFNENTPVNEILEGMAEIASSLQKTVNAKLTTEASTTHLETRLRLAGEALDLETRLRLAGEALDLKREKIAKFDEICTENSGLHEQVAAQADQIQQLTDDLEVSEYSRKELYEAIQPFARTGSTLTENPPKNLVNTNLFAGTKNEASPDGSMTYWAYPAVAITVSDCRAVAKYLKKA